MKRTMCICDECGSNENKVISKNEVLSVRGEDIKVNSNIRVCVCGNELFDEHLDEDNLKRAYDEYRKRHQLLSPDEIRLIREKYDIPQRTLGKILGWGEVTIHRYETGAIPDSSHHKMLKLLENPLVMKELLVDSQDLIPKTTFRRAMERINSLLEEKEEENFLSLLQRKFEHITVNVESGFKQFNLQKFTNVVLYFSQNVRQLWKTKLNKLLFYSDFKYFKEFTLSLTGSQYIKLEYGPVPKDYEGLLWGLEQAGFIKIAPSELGHHTGYLIEPLSDYDPDVFLNEELDILAEICQKYGNYSSTEISELSHKENGWINTPFSDVISYKYAIELNDK